MKKISGLCVGAGSSAMYIGLGFVPDEITLQALTGTTLGRMTWNRHQIRNTIMPEGIQRSTQTASALADGAGIELYYGGDAIVTANANQVAHITHSALADDWARDQRQPTGSGYSTVTKWTKDATVAGHFDQLVNETYVGAGSRMQVVSPTGAVALMEYAIVTFTTVATTASHVVLNNEPASSTLMVRFLGAKQDFVALPAGKEMPAGIKINETTLWNYSGVLFLIEAINW